jgi:hypothetical protein
VFGLVTGFSGPLKFITTTYSLVANSLQDALHLLSLLRLNRLSPGIGSQRRRFLCFPVLQLLSSLAGACRTTNSVWLQSQATDCQPRVASTVCRWLVLTSPCLRLRLAVYRLSVRLGAKPLQTHDQRFFFFLQLNTCDNSPYVTSSLSRRWVCLSWIDFAFVKCTYRTYSMLLKTLPCALYKIPC